MTIAEAVKIVSELEDPQTGMKSHSLAFWFVPHSGFLAAIVYSQGGDIRVAQVVWNYHTTPEEAVEALMSEAQTYINQKSPKDQRGN